MRSSELRGIEGGGEGQPELESCRDGIEVDEDVDQECMRRLLHSAIKMKSLEDIDERR